MLKRRIVFIRSVEILEHSQPLSVQETFAECSYCWCHKIMSSIASSNASNKTIRGLPYRRPALPGSAVLGLLSIDKGELAGKSVQVRKTL
jgi:hypothetical protein